MNEYYISPGYRYNLDNKGFLAFSFNYLNLNSMGRVIGVELDGRYYTNRMSLSGTASYSPDYGSTLDLSANYRMSNQVVCGVNLKTDAGDLDLSSGLTWVKTPFIINAKLGTDANGYYYDLSGYYSAADNLLLGLTYDGKEDSEVLRLHWTAACSITLW